MINLKFKIGPLPGFKTNIFKRWIMRVACIIVYNGKSTHYQFGGWSGFLKKAYVICDANKFQIMHWLLTVAGYSCCDADIMERCGVNPEDNKYD